MTPARVTVVGAGLSGLACAAALRSAGVEVEIRERGRAPGGRMASPSVHGRRVDLGAAYLTVKDPTFRAVVDGWLTRGLVREWTDTFEAFDAGTRQSKSGPMRYAAPAGLRSLVRDLTGDVMLGAEVTSLDEVDADVVVLAMPDPQAARLAGGAFEWVDYEPVIAVAAGWDERRWDLRDAGFVNGDPDVTLIADDGARRGDGSPVLVAHATPERSAAHLDDPDAAIEPVLAATKRLLGLPVEPVWTHAHRWTFAKPSTTHGDEPFGMATIDGRSVGVCSDSWCPSGAPRVESAWLSGHRLARRLTERD